MYIHRGRPAAKHVHSQVLLNMYIHRGRPAAKLHTPISANWQPTRKLQLFCWNCSFFHDFAYFCWKM